MIQLTRRELLKLGMAGAGTLTLFRPNWLQAAPSADREKDPQFFLQLIVYGGADQSYLFDARPLKMARAGKMQNYLGEEPTPWIGSNGVVCPTTSRVAPLLPFKDEISVINGVLVTPNAIGHEQNMNQFLTGNEFGGESFIPNLNLGDNGMKPTALDALASGFIFATLSNTAGVISLSPQSGDKLRGLLKTLPPADSDNETINFVRSRYLANAVGRGRFAAGAGLMLKGLENTPELHKVLSQIPQSPDQSAELQFCAMIGTCFRMSIARSAIWAVNQQQDVDAHSPQQAKEQPRTLKTLMEKVATIFKYLRETPFDSKRSLWDVTTVMVTSEFGRTMRSLNTPAENSGTDHNNLSNTVLIGGRGIRGGLVLGASDWHEPDEKLSGAHLAADQFLVKTMARPFDFKTWTTRADLPEKLDIKDYLTIGSVVNTVYKNFGSPVTRYHKLGRNLPAAPALDVLLKN